MHAEECKRQTKHSVSRDSPEYNLLCFPADLKKNNNPEMLRNFIISKE